MAIPQLPINISFNEWANQLYLDLPQYRIPIVTKEENWRKWAIYLLMDNRLDGIVPLPTEHSYPNIEDWRKWAKFFIDSLNN